MRRVRRGGCVPTGGLGATLRQPGKQEAVSPQRKAWQVRAPGSECLCFLLQPSSALEPRSLPVLRFGYEQSTPARAGPCHLTASRTWGYTGQNAELSTSIPLSARLSGVWLARACFTLGATLAPERPGQENKRRSAYSGLCVISYR